MTTKGVLKKRIEAVLREKGPMKSREIARELGEDPQAVASCIRSLAYAGRIAAARKDSTNGYDWGPV